MTRKGNPLKIWLGITEIAGNFSRLKKGFEELGHQVEFVDMSPHAFNYGGSITPPKQLTKILKSEQIRYKLKLLLNSRSSLKYSFLKPMYWLYLMAYIILTPINIAQFIFYFKKFDCLVFQYGNSFHIKARLVQFNDVYWLNKFGIKVIFLMCGSDSRPSFVDGAILGTFDVPNPENILKTTLETASNNQQIEKYATFVISNVFSSYFFSKPIIALQCVGNAALSASTIDPVDHENSNPTTIRILHAPSRTDVKGTQEIIEAIDELVAAGANLNLKIITEATNQEVINEIQNCDFVIDQLYSDLPLATFASEAASYKKPAIVGSYVSLKTFQKAYDVLGMPPSYICHPKDLKKAILSLSTDPLLRSTLGQEAYNYVTQVLSHKQVALRYIALINGNYPKEWLVDPQKYISALPVGLSNQKMKTFHKVIQESNSPLLMDIENNLLIKNLLSS